MNNELRQTLFELLMIASIFVLGCNQNNDATSLGESPISDKDLSQPLVFDHKAHIQAEDMDCLDCHRFADKGPYATIPRIKDCRDCHSEPQGEHPDEPKVREYLEKEEEISWVTVNKLPGHVYFSHRPHVVYGKMKCWDCHADMREVSKTINSSDIDHLSMSRCISCHQKNKVSNECYVCHK